MKRVLVTVIMDCPDSYTAGFVSGAVRQELPGLLFDDVKVLSVHTKNIKSNGL